jgi:hypothetical protein
MPTNKIPKFKERFQDKVKYPRLPKVKTETIDNPWRSLNSRFKEILDERREKELLEKKSSRKSSKSIAEKG